MRASQQDGLTPQHQLENFLLTNRSPLHVTTNVAPCDLFLGRRIHTQLDLVKPNLEHRVWDKQADQKQQHDQLVRLRELTIRQQVIVRNMRPGPSWVQGEIKQQLGPLTFLVSVAYGQTWKRHVDHLRDGTAAPMAPGLTVIGVILTAQKRLLFHGDSVGNSTLSAKLTNAQYRT